MKDTKRLVGLLILLVHACSNGQAVNQNSQVFVRTNAGKVLKLHSGSHALIIGISNYTNGWDTLTSVPSEVNLIDSVLTSRGFVTRLVMNPNGVELKSAFEHFIGQHGYEQGNRLLFFFSGHGYSRRENTRGYLVPADAPLPTIDEGGFLRKALSMTRILSWAREMEAKHALFLFDSCFSGTVFKTRSNGETPPHISSVTERPVRQFITSGSANETVPAKSEFCPLFIRGISGEADLSKDGYVTGTELGLFMQQELPRYVPGQTPQYGKIRDMELDEGDFVFVSGASVLPDAAVALRDIDLSPERESASVDKAGFFLLPAAVRDMLKRQDFYCGRKNAEDWANPSGRGIENRLASWKNGQVVIDFATQLMWHQAGADYVKSHAEAVVFADRLNREALAEYRDWRLPTLEEAMSLMEAEDKNDNLNIDPLFDVKQSWIWTADKYSETRAWAAVFSDGTCFHKDIDDPSYVRAVRALSRREAASAKKQIFREKMTNARGFFELGRWEAASKNFHEASVCVDSSKIDVTGLNIAKLFFDGMRFKDAAMKYNDLLTEL